ncbi:ABC transporter substrate-binding protein [Citricoccus sp. I39-566]|uniref:ABC transporter substrate-binding protein n=1 Tax=Citricoccus sp. I39-566 TaxID=3073268 RepID=UPI00286B1E8F|nr:ABC transporter substrate-binding protein [Citricoccus sp. I39-566]WMY78458.1 ABC transporter substrate-binding protein [Citricoccus sp. I39-566]
MKSTRISAISLGTAALLALTACGGGGEPQPSEGANASVNEAGFAVYTGDPVKGGTVRILNPTDFSHLDPAMGNDGGVNNFYRLIYRQLTAYEVKPGETEATVVPDLAEDTGTPNEDYTQWTFKLKDGIKYEDGTEITAADFKYALERSMDPALRVGSDFHIQYIKDAMDYQGVYEQPEGLDSIEVLGDKELRITLNQPTVNFPEIAAMQMFTPFPKDSVETTTQLDEDPIASGPYRVESYNRGANLTLVRNENWDEATDDVRPAYPDSFVFEMGLDPATIDQRLISGQGQDANAVSATSLSPANLAQTQDETIKNRTVSDIPNCTTYLGMNVTKEPLDDLKVRQAINYAVDKQSVVTATGGPDLTSLASEMLLPSVPGWEEFDLYETPDSAGDQERAQELLAEAGYPDGLEVTMDVRGLPKWQAQAEAVQDSLNEIGIDVTLNVIDGSTYYQVIGTPAQQNDIAITGWCSPWLNGDPLLSPLFHGERIYDTGNYNLAQIDDPEINGALDAAAVMTDLEEQQAAYNDINRAIMEQAPVVPLVRDTPLQVVGPNVAGAYSNPTTTGYVDYIGLGLKTVD